MQGSNPDELQPKKLTMEESGHKIDLLVGYIQQIIKKNLAGMAYLTVPSAGTNIAFDSSSDNNIAIRTK